MQDVGKVDILGAQDEVIYLEFSTRKIAALGLDVRSIMASLQAQNAVAPSGVFQEGPERISARVNGQFTSEASLKAVNLRVNDRFFPLTDVATITRGYVDPPKTLFRYNGQPAIGLAIGMKTGANLLHFGEALKKEMSKVIADLPIGVGVHLVANQPVVVEHAVSGFTHALFEAVVIVLAISFLSLRHARRSCRRNCDPAGSRDHFCRDGVCRHFVAANFARCIDHRARPSGR